MSQADLIPTIGPVTRAIAGMRERPALRLIVQNDSAKSQWDGARDSTLMTFTLPKEAINGAFYGVKNLLMANASMMMALESAKAGDSEAIQRNIDRAFVEMTSANAFAEKLYARVCRQSRRARPAGRA